VAAIVDDVRSKSFLVNQVISSSAAVRNPGKVAAVKLRLKHGMVHFRSTSDLGGTAFA
jgi:hypothetical protein